MAICRECNKEVLTDFQEIKTKRKSTVVICNKCLEEMKEENRRARDNQKLIREH